MGREKKIHLAPYTYIMEEQAVKKEKEKQNTINVWRQQRRYILQLPNPSLLEGKINTLHTTHLYSAKMFPILHSPRPIC